MKTFRGKEVIGWKLVVRNSQRAFEDEINRLMEQYNFEDFQFSISNIDEHITQYAATILLSNKVK